MVNVPKERAFPRGGREDRGPDGPKQKFPGWCTGKHKVESNKNKFQNRSKPWVKRNFQKKTNPEEIDVKSKKTQGSRAVRVYTGSLKCKTISEGMLILGTINGIKPYVLSISLPGNCVGHVPITNISECYTRALSSLGTATANSGVHRLQDMFHIGQHVITKVVKKEVVGNDNRDKIFLSLAPEVIHSDCTNEDVLKGTVFTAAVESVQEKGYVMDLGIKSVRAFLTKENAERFEHVWNKRNILGVGQLVRCLVTSATSADLVTTVVLTADPKLVANSSANTTGARLQGMLPGMHFKVTVVRHVYPSGIQVRLSNNVIGYVPPNHLSKNFKAPKDFQVDRVHSARVLYILPSGAIFFTMKNNICPANPPASPFKAIKAGYTTKSAVIWDVSEAGLTVKLGKKDDASLKGFIPFKHIGRKLSEEKDPETKPSDILLKEFPIGSNVTCRIMNYCYMDQYYICTMDEDLMKEPYIHPSTLKVGLVVQCIVKEISPTGIVMALGKKSPVTGFVSPLHVSNVPLSHPEKKFHVGQTCTAKVLSVDFNLLLTMKQGLIESNDMLVKYESAEIGKNYPGTVIVVDRNGNGILVEFYSNFTSWLPRSAMGLSRNCDVKEIFHVGHLVYCRVIGKNPDTHKLSLTTLDHTRPLPKEIFPQEDVEKESQSNDQANTADANVIKEKKKTKAKANVNGAVASGKRKIIGTGDKDSCQDHGELKKRKKNYSLKDLDKTTNVIKEKKKTKTKVKVNVAVASGKRKIIGTGNKDSCQDHGELKKRKKNYSPKDLDKTTNIIKEKKKTKTKVSVNGDVASGKRKLIGKGDKDSSQDHVELKKRKKNYSPKDLHKTKKNKKRIVNK